MKNRKKLNPWEKSFTLFETIIALSIMSVMMIEMMGLQANVIYFHGYGANLNRATYLAKRVLSQVEYLTETKEFSELKRETDSEVVFKDYPNFSYVLKVSEWKLPIFDLISGMSGSSEGESSDEGSGNDPKSEEDKSGLSAMLKQILGEDLLKVAHVTVSWSDGAKKNDTSLTLLLTNQKKVDSVIAQFKPRGSTKTQKKSASKSTPDPDPGGSL